MACKGIAFILFSCLFITSCKTVKKVIKEAGPESVPREGAANSANSANSKTFTKPLKISRSEFVSYAKKFLGTPYRYGSSNPKNGFDCSGFISHVLSHFNVKAPRSSVDFTNEGTTIDIRNAKPGEIILFTGSDNSSGSVGHMGIITSGGISPQFIHSASGKNIGVILSNVTGYYKTHFVKVIRLLE